MRQGVLCALVCALLVPAMQAQAVTWQGQDWDISAGAGNTTTTVNGNELEVEFTATGQWQFHINRILPGNGDESGSFVNENDTPWIRLNFTLTNVEGNAPFQVNMFIDDESGVAGSLKNPRSEFSIVHDPSDTQGHGGSYAFGEIKYTEPDALPTPDTDTLSEKLFSSATTGDGTTHSLLVGKAADDTVQFVLDGVLHTSTFWKDNYHGDIDFGDVHLRILNPSYGATVPQGTIVTFTDFEAGNDFALIPTPAAAGVGLVGMGLLAMRRGRREEV